jgi:hypothetical protein
MTLVFGSTLAALVAVSEFARLGKKVTWLKPQGRVAGHFFGTEFRGHPIDVGMVAVESFKTNSFSFDKETPPTGARGLDYLGHAIDWWGEIGVPLKPLKIQTVVEQDVIPDYLIRDSLEFLRLIPESERVQVELELTEKVSSLTENDFMHPRNKRESRFYQDKDIREVCSALYGNTLFRRFFEPWISKFLGSERELRAIDHRIIWAPIYYPETLLEALRSKLALSTIERPFLYPKSETISSVVRRLLDSCLSNDLVNCVDVELPEIGQAASYISDLKDTPRVFFGSKEQLLILGEGKQVRSKLKQLEERGSRFRDRGLRITVANFGLSHSPVESGVFNLLNAGKNAYRASIHVNDNHPEGSFAAVELSGDLESENAILGEALAALEAIGVEALTETAKISQGQIQIPTFGNAGESNSADSKLDLSGWGGKVIERYNSSLNDQISLGLWGVQVS